MRGMHLVALFLGWLALCTGPVHAQAAKARVPLTKPQKESLDNEVLPAVHQQSDAALLTALGPLVAKATDSQVQAFDDYLAEKKLPPVAELLSAARVKLAEQNLQSQAPPPKARELALTLRGLKTKIDEVVALYRTDLAFDAKAPAPKDLTQYEDRFWDMHVVDNRILAAGRLAKYAVEIVEESRKQSNKAFNAADKEVLDADYGQMWNNLASMSRELAERTMELRVKRLEYAARVVGSNGDLKDRFLAAFVIDLDGDLLANFFKQLHTAGPTPGNQPQQQTIAPQDILFCKSLAAADLPPRIAELRDSGRKSAGESFLTKSRQLFTGLHWWYRGRYGMGSEGGGLLKSKLALASPEAMFGLYMPVETPQPTDPTKPGQPVPQFDRRHHYLWQFETRSILTTGNKVSTDKDFSQDIVSITTTKHFY